MGLECRGLILGSTCIACENRARGIGLSIDDDGRMVRQLTLSLTGSSSRTRYKRSRKADELPQSLVHEASSFLENQYFPDLISGQRIRTSDTYPMNAGKLVMNGTTWVDSQRGIARKVNGSKLAQRVRKAASSMFVLRNHFVNT